MDIRSISQIESMRSKITAFLKERTGGRELQPEDDIFATGYVNSLFVVQLIAWMEKTFDFKVVGTDLNLANFRTIEAISQFIQRKQTSAIAGER